MSVYIQEGNTPADIARMSQNKKMIALFDSEDKGAEGEESGEDTCGRDRDQKSMQTTRSSKASISRFFKSLRLKNISLVTKTEWMCYQLKILYT